MEISFKQRVRFWSKVSIPSKEECWLWTAGKFASGYGCVSFNDKSYPAHRVAYELTFGPITGGLFACHKCDTPACVSPYHIFLGTQADNIADRDAKGRTARGDRSGSRLHPERVARGDRSGSRLHPESRPRGDMHYARRHPERMPRGERHGSRTHPESRPRGEAHGMAIVTADDVRTIRAEYVKGSLTNGQTALGRRYGLTQSAVRLIVIGKNWKSIL